MTRRLVARYFCPVDDWPGRPWERMARVLEHTARKHCSGWSIEVREMPVPAENPVRGAHAVANTAKLEEWTRAVLEAEDGARILLIDADTVILHRLDVVWGMDFDVAYTVRPKAMWPINAGVVFLKVNERSRAFMAEWNVENLRLFHDQAAHARVLAKWGGMNQSALGSLLDGGIVKRLGLGAIRLPCSEFNCEDSTWPEFDPKVARVLHLKGALRRTILKIGHGTPVSRPLAALWAELELEAIEAEAKPA